MGMPDAQQTALPNEGYLFKAPGECPKYNWKKMDAYERVGVNVMDACGAKNAVIGGAFGLFIFAVVLFFFRKQVTERVSWMEKKEGCNETNRRNRKQGARPSGQTGASRGKGFNKEPR